eukprot:Lithocolla_globosa_v1_NODE_1807_length_2321_cov_196.591792.p3 type:complete len:118 gc:universal NODE_1807_length_2321_cov_196.591792:236-589(+)
MCNIYESSPIFSEKLDSNWDLKSPVITFQVSWCGSLGRGFAVLRTRSVVPRETLSMLESQPVVRNCSESVWIGRFGVLKRPIRSSFRAPKLQLFPWAIKPELFWMVMLILIDQSLFH